MRFSKRDVIERLNYFPMVGLVVLVSLAALGCQLEAVAVEDPIANSIVRDSTPSVLPTQTPMGEKDAFVEWAGRSGGFDINWLGDDLFIGDDRTRGMFAQLVENYCKGMKSPGEPACYCASHLLPVSVVGSMVSVDHETSYSCQGSYLNWRYATFDLAKKGGFVYADADKIGGERPVAVVPGKLVSLTDLFPETEIFTALTNTELVKQTIATGIEDGRLEAPPRTLDELNNYLAKFDTVSREWNKFMPDYLTRFVFHHVSGERVAIRLSLSQTAHVSHAVHDHLEIELLIPEKLRLPIRLADSRQEGFLMKDASMIVGTESATFEKNP